MPNYRVRLSCQYTFDTFVNIEADSPEEAEQMGLDNIGDYEMKMGNRDEDTEMAECYGEIK